MVTSKKKTEIDKNQGTSYSTTLPYITTPISIKIGRDSDMDRLTLKENKKTENKLIEDNF